MNIVDTTQINKFASEMQADVSPEESVFVLTSSQLQEIISQAVQKAVLEATEPLYQEIAYDRQRIAKLEQREPQPLQKDRAKILKALLASNGGRMLSTEARKTMHMSRSGFSELITSMKDDIETKPYHLHKNWKVLSLKRYSAEHRTFNPS